MLHTNSTTSDVSDLSGPSSGWAKTICTTIKLRCLNTLTELACKVKLTWKFPLWSLARETEGQTTKRRTASRLLSRFILPRSHRVIGVFTSQGSCLNFYTYVTDFPRGQKWPNLTSQTQWFIARKAVEKPICCFEPFSRYRCWTLWSEQGGEKWHFRYRTLLRLAASA